MQIALSELEMPATLLLHRDKRVTDREYVSFCEANPDLRLERTSEGEIVIVPPAGMESDYRSLGVGGELRAWAKRDGRGKAFGCSVQFFLLNGAARSPDAAWMSNARLASVAPQERRRFAHTVPEFVIEVMSPSDRRAAAQRKMREWIENGVELAWLIDGDARTVHVYSAGRDPEVFSGIDEITGEGPVAGFVLDLREIWAGL